MKKKFYMDFLLFDGEPVPQQTHPLNPNWTGQAPGVGTYTEAQDLTPEMKTFWDRDLIKHAKPNLIHDQFGQKRPIPAGRGKTIEFRKYSKLPKALTPLTEGITPKGQNFSVTAITATVEQFGAYIAMTDMLDLTAFDNNAKEVAQMLGEQAGLTSDTITRDIIQAGTNVSFVGTGVTKRTDITTDSTLTVHDVKLAQRKLARQNAPKIDGNYVAIVHPDTVLDLWEDPDWIEMNEYAGSTKLFEGEVGKIFGVRFVETTEAKIWKDETCPVTEDEDIIPIYGTLVLGANAYGVTQINGKGIETIAKALGSGGTADPLNQRSTIGWKLNKTAKILSQEFMVRVEHTTSLWEDADAN